MNASMTAPTAYVVTRTDATGSTLPGFVVVSMNEQMPAVLGYSTDGVFPDGNLPEHIAAWMDSYETMADTRSVVAQQQNAVAAIKQGGLTGKVLQGVEANLASRSVPVRESDFIFASVCEEFGFIGAVLVLLGYAFMILMIIRIARKSKDYLGRMMAVGFGAMLLVQVSINIGVVTYILPNTGIALPFMSSGLSSLLVNLLMIGILLNISLQPRGKAKVREESPLGYIDIK